MVRPAALLAMAATLCTLQRAAAFLPARLATVSARPSAALYARAGALRTLAMIRGGFCFQSIFRSTSRDS